MQFVRTAAAFALSAAALLTGCEEAPTAPIQKAALSPEQRAKLDDMGKDFIVTANKDALASIIEARRKSLDGNARIFKISENEVEVLSHPLSARTYNNEKNTMAIVEHKVLERIFPDRGDYRISFDQAVKGALREYHNGPLGMAPVLVGQANSTTSVINFSTGRVCTESTVSRKDDCFSLHEVTPGTPLAKDIDIAKRKYQSAPVHLTP